MNTTPKLYQQTLAQLAKPRPDGSQHTIPVTGGEELLDYETRLLEPREGPHDPQPPTNRKQRRGQRRQSRERR